MWVMWQRTQTTSQHWQRPGLKLSFRSWLRRRKRCSAQLMWKANALTHLTRPHKMSLKNARVCSGKMTRFDDVATPRLTPDQITQVSGLVAGYISTQHDNYAGALPLTAQRRAAVAVRRGSFA